MKLADKDNSGYIDQEEFLIAMKCESKGTSQIIKQIKEHAVDIIQKKQEQDIIDAFQVLD